jgi:uncharacterized protein (UPF0264 family)
MKLLVSPVDAYEAAAAFRGGADIIDIKNPGEGSLGASFPWVIKEVHEAVSGGAELSATLGDMDYRPGFASLASYGLSRFDVDYIKAGLLVPKKKWAAELASSIARAAENSNSKLVLAGYGDYRKIPSISPQNLPGIACDAGAHGIMIDTFKKNGDSLFEHMSVDELTKFIEEGRKCGLKVALAGSISAEHVHIIKELAPDIVGVRGATCSRNDRKNGRIEKEKVKEFKKSLC